MRSSLDLNPDLGLDWMLVRSLLSERPFLVRDRMSKKLLHLSPFVLHEIVTLDRWKNAGKSELHFTTYLRALAHSYHYRNYDRASDSFLLDIDWETIQCAAMPPADKIKGWKTIAINCDSSDPYGEMISGDYPELVDDMAPEYLERRISPRPRLQHYVFFRRAGAESYEFTPYFLEGDGLTGNTKWTPVHRSVNGDYCGTNWVQNGDQWIYMFNDDMNS